MWVKDSGSHIKNIGSISLITRLSPRHTLQGKEHPQDSCEDIWRWPLSTARSAHSCHVIDYCNGINQHVKRMAEGDMTCLWWVRLQSCSLLRSFQVAICWKKSKFILVNFPLNHMVISFESLDIKCVEDSGMIPYLVTSNEKVATHYRPKYKLYFKGSPRTNYEDEFVCPQKVDKIRLL